MRFLNDLYKINRTQKYDIFKETKHDLASFPSYLRAERRFICSFIYVRF